jgi:hypothetical protein
VSVEHEREFPAISAIRRMSAAPDTLPRAPLHPSCSGDARRGVYVAYTAGLRAAWGEYVWFVGEDDYPQDAVAEIAPLQEERAFDVLAAPVLFSSGRLYKPTRRRAVLLFLNWCQQGVVYRRRVLRRYRFCRPASRESGPVRRYPSSGRSGPTHKVSAGAFVPVRARRRVRSRRRHFLPLPAASVGTPSAWLRLIHALSCASRRRALVKYLLRLL